MDILLKDFTDSSDNYLLISGIQHFVFCRRQWALIHIEQIWDENFFTIDGQIKHRIVDTGIDYQAQKNKRTIRGMPIVSHTLKMRGKCDVVELHPNPNGFYFSKYNDKYSVYPVEYKRGRPKKDESDIMQLLAQAICLEEMLGVRIDSGACFYFETRRRERVEFTAELRSRLFAIIDEMNGYYYRRYTPKVKRTKRCNMCSLKDYCLPELSGRPSVMEYIEMRLQE